MIKHRILCPGVSICFECLLVIAAFLQCHVEAKSSRMLLQKGGDIKVDCDTHEGCLNSGDLKELSAKVVDLFPESLEHVCNFVIILSRSVDTTVGYEGGEGNEPLIEPVEEIVPENLSKKSKKGYLRKRLTRSLSLGF